jgi:uncharacterized RDD family membrane protein YckC
MSYASVSSRFVAVLIDLIVFVAIGFVLALLSGSTETTSAPGQVSTSAYLDGGNFFLWIAIALVYYTVMEASCGGSLGKLVTGIRVVDSEGDPISWGQALVRNSLRPIDGLFCYVVALISIAASSEQQRLGDRAASTFVVRLA